MAALNVAPTKTNLIELKSRLEFATLGHELLDQKRNILVNELLSHVDRAEGFLSDCNEAIAVAFRHLLEAARRTGMVKLQYIASGVDISSTIELARRRVMGVALPVVETEFSDHPPYFSSVGSSIWIDSAISRFKEALELTGKLAESKISIVRLSREVKKTIRKVNALEKIAIPDLKETVATITDRLDEAEREMFVLMRAVKNRLTEKRTEVS